MPSLSWIHLYAFLFIRVENASCSYPCSPALLPVLLVRAHAPIMRLVSHRRQDVLTHARRRTAYLSCDSNIMPLKHISGKLFLSVCMCVCVACGLCALYARHVCVCVCVCMRALRPWLVLCCMLPLLTPLIPGHGLRQFSYVYGDSLRSTDLVLFCVPSLCYLSLPAVRCVA